MRFINAFAAATALFSPAYGQLTIKVCKDAGFVNCADEIAEALGDCVNIKTEFVNSITSLDSYGVGCRFYDTYGCLGRSIDLTYGADDLSKGDYAYMNDQIDSFRCLSRKN
ncbi:hypothetical protein LZ554_004364 [Drepanopeziza brunnea f. sp. 'monogermtubi']|nr:hypothetical protein LZ554_004364 [Drepanopeziza brunnea f. sp. 'monogermtubi']